MGTTSSQLEPSQSQNIDQELDDTQASLPRLDGAIMDDSTQHEDEIHVKRKLKSVDATRPVKRSKKDHESDGLVEERIEVKDSQDATANAHQDATEASFKKPSKKKSKKEQMAQVERDHDVGSTQATQSSVVMDETPQSTADTINSDAPKRVKTKRKKHTGRPSGLNIMPAGMSDPATQDDSVGPGADRGDVIGPSSQPVVVVQAETRKTNLPSSGTTNAQSSQTAPQKKKAPKAKNAMVDATSAEVDNVSKSHKRRRAESPENMEELPTPGGATQARSPRSKQKPMQPTNYHDGDDGALRDDYAEVDATRQVEGWLSSQIADEDLVESSSVRSPDGASRKKAAKSESTKREVAPLQQDKATTKKRKRTSKNHDNDSEDFEPDEDRDILVEETPGSMSKHSNNPTNLGTVLSTHEAATQDTASPLVSKKGRMSSHTNEKRAKKSTVVEDELASENHAKKSTKKKQRQSQFAEDDNEEEEGSNKKLGPSDRRTKKGPLSAADKAMVDGIFQETLKDTGIRKHDLCAMIKNWKTATDFKEAVEEALPDRPRAAIRKFCQRRYHNMERGPWSSEDDDALKKAYKASPDKWTEIGALVGRTASDCKDRWKNTVSIQDTMQVGPWSQEETASLIEAVASCIKDLRKSNKENKGLSRPELERMLSWAEVAKKLGGTRSAKRCNEKWQKLKRDEYAGRASISAQPLSIDAEEKQVSRKLRLIQKSYNECDIGDLYDMLTEIHTALPNPQQHFDHESTLWAVISMKNPGSRFKSAMRRKGLYDASKVYAADVPDMPTIAGKAKALADHIEAEWGVEALAEKRAFGPKPKASKIKSAERVDSDEEAEEVENDEEREAPETDTPPTSNDDGDEEDGNLEDDDGENPGAEIPDSQPLPAAKSKRSGDEFKPSFKPVNSKKHKEPTSSPAGSDVVEQLPSATKRKKSTKPARAKMQS